MTDAYTLLGVPRTATSEEIRKAYKRKAMATHPDRGGSTEAFTAVKSAFELLADPLKRSQLDNALAGGASSGNVMTPEYAAERATRDDIDGVCSLCGGEGVIRVAGSIFWTRNPCPKCKGKKS